VAKKRASKPKSFTKLTRPIIRAIHFAYGLRRKNRHRNIPWGGPETPSTNATCFPPRESLQVGNLKYEENDQGRDALTVIVGLAVRLGIEQGRALEREERERKYGYTRILLNGIRDALKE